MPPIRIIATSVSLLVISITVQADTWIEVESENFLLRSNTDEDVARQTVEDLEKFRIALGHVTSLDFSDDSSPKLTIYAYKSEAEYMRRHRMSGTAGFFKARPSGPVAVMSLEAGKQPWDLSGREILFHELTHFLIDRNSSLRYPVWYDEGFADFVSTMRFEDNAVIVGEPVVQRLLILKNTGPTRWISMRELVENKARYIYYDNRLSRTSSRRQANVLHQYAQGWLVTHFLNNSQKYHAGIAPYIRAINQDIDAEIAFRDAFGVEYRELDDAVRAYWLDRKLPVVTFELADEAPIIDSNVRMMTAVEARAVHFEARLAADQLQSRGARRRAARAFNNVLAAGTRPLDMHDHLVRIAILDEDWDTARHHLERIFAIREDYAPALTLKAYIAQQGLEVEEVPADMAPALLALYHEAVEADPAYVPALMGYARMSLHESQEVPDDVPGIIESIRAYVPRNPDGMELRARLLVRTGDYVEALETIRIMIDWARTDKQERQFRKFHQEVEEAMQARASAPDS